MMQIPSVVLATWLGGLREASRRPLQACCRGLPLHPAPAHFALHTSNHLGGAVLFVLVSLGLAWQVNRWRRPSGPCGSRAIARPSRRENCRRSSTRCPRPCSSRGSPASPRSRQTLWRLAVRFRERRLVDGRPPRFESADGSATLDAANLPVARAAARGVEVRDEEFSAIYDDGTSERCSATRVPLVGGRGGVRGAVGAFVDISERKRAETVLHQYQLLARHTRDVVLFVRRRDGRLLEANAAAETAYGYTREELLERTIFDLRSARRRADHAGANGGRGQPGRAVRDAPPPPGRNLVPRRGELARHDPWRRAGAAQRHSGHHRARSCRAIAAREREPDEHGAERRHRVHLVVRPRPAGRCWPTRRPQRGLAGRRRRDRAYVRRVAAAGAGQVAAPSIRRGDSRPASPCSSRTSGPGWFSITRSTRSATARAP